MYSENDLIEIANIKQSLKDKYKKRRQLRSNFYHHGAHIRVRLTGAILGMPLLVEIYFWGIIGLSLIISLPIAIWYWKGKTVLVKKIEREADEIRFEIVKVETRLKKEFSLIYESYKNFLYSPREHYRFDLNKNELTNEKEKIANEREIDQDWL